MIVFQIIAVLFAFLMIYIVNIHRRKHSLSTNEVWFWYFIWISFIIVSFFPQTLVGIAESLHFARTFDLLVVIAMMILTTIVVIGYFAQKDAAKKLEEYVRKEAIKKAKTHE